jgi:ABC-type transport system involved in multi-copper enzyme maturation permease subunit
VIQCLAAIPWLTVVLLPSGKEFSWRRQLFGSENVVRNLLLAGAVLFCGALLAALFWQMADQDAQQWFGRLYGAILQLQLTADFFTLVIVGLLQVWPKGGAVALAAFREGLRQPMFWLLLLLGVVLLILFPFIPYFTLGDDTLMVKEMGYETIMLFTLIFTLLTASMSITDEIEGRTAITLMSKPVSRRQFLLGKFVGIFLSGLVLVAILGWCFNGMVLLKVWLSPLEGNIESAPPVPLAVDFASFKLETLGIVPAGAALLFVRGSLLWLVDALQYMPGLILNACQVLVVLALAVALATRVTMVINLVCCLAVYILSHLSPVLLDIANRRLTAAPNDAGPRLLSFVASLLSSVLPENGYFSIGPALVTDSPPPLLDFYKYTGEVLIYALLYSAIVMLIGLLAFEDRDLA